MVALLESEFVAVNVPAFVPPKVTVWATPPTYAVTLAGLTVHVVDFTVTLTVAVAFPLPSFTVIVVLPAATGVIVNVLPLMLVVALLESEFVAVNVPAFVPLNVTVLLPPPT